MKLAGSRWEHIGQCWNTNLIGLVSLTTQETGIFPGPLGADLAAILWHAVNLFKNPSYRRVAV